MHTAEGPLDCAILVLLTDFAKLIKTVFEFAALEHHVIPVVHAAGLSAAQRFKQLESSAESRESSLFQAVGWRYRSVGSQRRTGGFSRRRRCTTSGSGSPCDRGEFPPCPSPSSPPLSFFTPSSLPATETHPGGWLDAACAFPGQSKQDDKRQLFCWTATAHRERRPRGRPSKELGPRSLNRAQRRGHSRLSTAPV